MVSSTRATLQVSLAFLGTCPENIWPDPEKSKNVLKTVKIEGYNTRFQNLAGPEFRMSWNAS